MGGSLTQLRRVGDEGLRVVKPCRRGRILTVPYKKAPANEAGSVFEIQVEGMGGENPKGFEPSRRFRE